MTDQPTPCPVCAAPGGFHDKDKHSEHEVPRELIKESGWLPKLLEEERRRKEAEGGGLPAV